jgi:hypothetical protein
VTTILEQSDRVAGGVARAAATLGQMSLVALGVHLAADRLDDQLWDLLTALSDQLDATLSAPLARVADTFGLGFDTFLFWQSLPLPLIAATTCLLWELLADIMLWDAFLLTPRSTHVTWSKYRRSLSLRAIVLPITLTGVLLSGAWSLFMATEDILPTHDASSWVAAAVALLALVHYGRPAWTRAIGNLERPKSWKRQLGLATVLLPIGLTAWLTMPVWGWLP